MTATADVKTPGPPTGYPSWVYNETQPALVVQSQAVFALLPGPGTWRDTPYPPPPGLTSLNPTTAMLGGPNFTLHVLGSGFSPTSVIVWNGADEPTTFISESEVTTDVDMSTATVAMDVPVAVREDTLVSTTLTFTLIDPGATVKHARPEPKGRRAAKE